ncbi:MAG TPA: hypothetical protein PKN34_05350 [Azospira sp.]|nr:hypothetical protein [Azospira sp.]
MAIVSNEMGIATALLKQARRKKPRRKHQDECLFIALDAMDRAGKGKEAEGTSHQIFAGRNPGDAFDVGRMQGKQHRPGQRDHTGMLPWS